MKKDICKKYDWIVFVVAFLLMLVMFHTVGLLSGIGIYGERTILKWDATSIYINFLAYLWDILKGNTNEVAYTLSIMPGNGNSLLIGWFLFSPFNLIILLFDKASLPDAFFWIVCLKLSTASMCMSVFLVHVYRRIKAKLSFPALPVIGALSIGYAYCGLVAGHTHEIMYFDALIVLPLIADGLYKICLEGKVLQYYLALAYGIITNFYFGFMLCIFSALYFLYVAVRYRKLKYTIRFVVISVLAASSAAAVIFPMLYQIPKSKLAGEGGEVFSFTRFSIETVIVMIVISIVYLLYRLMTSRWYKGIFDGWKCYVCDGVLIGGALLLFHEWFAKLAWKGDWLQNTIIMPTRLLVGVFRVDDYMPLGQMSIYASLFVALILLLYFMDYRVDHRTKLINAESFILCFLMMGFRQINMVWHGFTYPAGSFYRWSFFISFLMIAVAYEYLIEAWSFEPWSVIKEIKSRTSFCGVLVISLLIVLALRMYKRLGLSYIDKRVVIFSLVFLVLYFGLCAIIRRTNNKGLKSLIIVPVMAELIINALISAEGFEYTRYDEYASFIKTSHQVMEDILKEDNDDEYRVESAYKYEWWYISGYNSVYHIGSAYTADNARFMQNFDMGVNDDVHGKMSINNFSLSSQLAGFLGIRYLLSDKKLAYEEYKLINKYIDEWTSDEYYLYRNNVSLPLIFRANKESLTVTSLDLGSLERLVQDYDKKNDETGLLSTGASVYSAQIECDDDEVVVWSLPYDIGWDILVDGKRIEATKAYGFLMAAEVSGGLHNIMIRYTPPYLYAGVIVSILSLVLFLLSLFIFQNRRTKL